MKVQVHAIHFNADKKLVESIQAKLNKLETFYDQITSGDVFLHVASGVGRIREKYLEIKLAVPGGILFVKEKAKSFEEALDLALNSLAEQIKRFKSKMNQVKPNRPFDLLEIE
jgi:putative sigma-54 modulation protein